MIQEYIAGADSIAEDLATRDYVVMRARMMAAKSVTGNLKYFDLPFFVILFLTK